MALKDFATDVAINGRGVSRADGIEGLRSRSRRRKHNPISNPTAAVETRITELRSADNVGVGPHPVPARRVGGIVRTTWLDSN